MRDSGDLFVVFTLGQTLAVQHLERKRRLAVARLEIQDALVSRLRAFKLADRTRKQSGDPQRFDVGGIQLQGALGRRGRLAQLPETQQFQRGGGEGCGFEAPRLAREGGARRAWQQNAEPPQGFAMFGLRLQHAAIGRFGGRQIARRLGLLAA